MSRELRAFCGFYKNPQGRSFKIDRDNKGVTVLRLDRMWGGDG